MSHSSTQKHARETADRDDVSDVAVAVFAGSDWPYLRVACSTERAFGGSQVSMRPWWKAASREAGYSKNL